MAHTRTEPGRRALERELHAGLAGEVRFDALTRGLYSTDASHYQIEPLGVVFPRSSDDVVATLDIARRHDVPVLPRGGGTSQGGQAIGQAVIVDTTKHLTHIGTPMEDTDGHPCIDVDPGVVLDELNRVLKPTGMWFPVDPSTASRATLGGMAGNNSAGARSIVHGMMVDNVESAEVILADGRRGVVGRGGTEADFMAPEIDALDRLWRREADEILRRRPKTAREVAGYNLHQLEPSARNIARMLVGSEGTLAFFSKLRVRLAPIPRHTVLGVCHFEDLVEGLDTVQHLVTLRPSAVELIDRTVLELAAGNPHFRDAVATFVRGRPAAVLVVEFTSDDAADLSRRLDDLESLLGALGHPGAVTRAETQRSQQAVWDVRKGGLNLVMSMAGPRKPISFIEDCAVPLEHLAEYARRVDEVFRTFETPGTWYAHASVGCLHVRPALNLADPDDLVRLRRIADETHSIVREFGGTHSGEHGDGIVRSEFLTAMLGERMTRSFAEVKRLLDPQGTWNPGKIVDPPSMDDPALMRPPTALMPSHSSSLPVVTGWGDAETLLHAVTACDSNGACRKQHSGVMCPSYRATLDERDSTRGRANALRLALTGQLGADGLASPDLDAAMELCISCKACRSECPNSVDMARLKLAWQAHRSGDHKVSARDRWTASLPRIAPRISPFARIVNRLGRALPKRALGLASERALPTWSTAPWRDRELPRSDQTPEAVLFVDTFSRWFDPEIPRAAARVLNAGQWATQTLSAPLGAPPLCCGRTYLSAGMVEEARVEATRLLAAAAPIARAGAHIVGLEPSCLYTLRDEIPMLVPGEDADIVASRAVMFEEYLDERWDGPDSLPFAASTSGRSLLVHGHCHQKAFGGSEATLRALGRIPGASIEEMQTGCCGMAGAFGYRAEHYDTSMRIGELDLFPQARAARPEALLVASGTSCRAQIYDGTGRSAEHPAVVIDKALKDATPG